MCAPKIGAAPVAGQALLPKKTLRRKVSLAKHYVRWANVCHGKANELTNLLKVSKTAYEPCLGSGVACGTRALGVGVEGGAGVRSFAWRVPAGRDSRLGRVD